MLISRTYLGPRFVAGHQTPSTGFNGTTTFVATTPAFVLSAASTKALVIARMTFSQIGTVAGADIGFILATDTADRYSTGGTTIASKNIDRTSGITSTATLKAVEPTASAAGAGTYYFGERLIDNVVGTSFVLEFPDGIVIPKSGSFLGHWWAAAADPRLAVTLEWLEV